MSFVLRFKRSGTGYHKRKWIHCLNQCHTEFRNVFLPKEDTQSGNCNTFMYIFIHFARTAQPRDALSVPDVVARCILCIDRGHTMTQPATTCKSSVQTVKPSYPTIPGWLSESVLGSPFDVLAVRGTRHVVVVMPECAPGITVGLPESGPHIRSGSRTITEQDALARWRDVDQPTSECAGRYNVTPVPSLLVVFDP